ncbi:MAG: hypothetical protein KGI38_07715 [Thaumarchaeota archaeon]|nr:hypothetical protein [Nitrososphaerota archaeon]
MKISNRRKAISQSMDLFIIIAAVLGVGGVVSASVYNLVSSATTNSSITIVGASLKAGATPSSSPIAISLSIKNNGGDPISCTAATSCQVVFAGTSTGTAAATCSSPCTISPGGALGWNVGASPGPLTFSAISATSELAPGAQTSFVLNGALSTTGTATFWESGSPVTINVLFGSATAQVTVVSQ